MELILLGTAGGPRPAANRSAPAQAIVHDGKVHVVDCGSGVITQLVKAGVNLADIATISITHHHADHIMDMGALPLTAWTDGLQGPVKMYGPPPTASSYQSFISMMNAELEARTATTGRIAFQDIVDVEEITGPGLIHEDGDLKITTTLVDHPPFAVALGYRFDIANESIVFSGDTRYSENLIELATGADILVHEAIHPESLSLQLQGAAAATLKEHLLGTHTTAEDAGRVAHAAGVKTLVLSHLVPYHEGVTDEMWRSAAAQHFSGEIVVGRDLMRLNPQSSASMAAAV